MKKLLNLLFISILVITASCSKKETYTVPTKVNFTFDAIQIEESTLKAKLTNEEAPLNVHYIIREANTNKLALEGNTSRKDILNLELLPGEYKCYFYCMKEYSPILNINKLNSQHFYQATINLKVLETGTTSNVTLKRFVSGIEIVKSEGLSMLTWISLKSSITSPTEINLQENTLNTPSKYNAISEPNNYNLLFPCKDVKVEVILHSDLTGNDYDKYFKIFTVKPNTKYKVIVKLIGGGNGGSDLGGAKLQLDLEESWNGDIIIQ